MSVNSTDLFLYNLPFLFARQEGTKKKRQRKKIKEDSRAYLCLIKPYTKRLDGARYLWTSHEKGCIGEYDFIYIIHVYIHM